MKSRTIVSYQNPVRVNIADWLATYFGRYAVGKRVSGKEADLYAYSDNQDDIQEMSLYAKNNQMLTFRSVSMEGVTSIDEY